MRGCFQWLGWVGISSAVLLAAACNRGTAPTPTALTPAAPSEEAHAGGLSHESAVPQSKLTAVRAITAKYHDVEAAQAAGYQLGFRGVVTGCIDKPGVGAMGYHYFNWTKMDDASINEDDPEVLVYHTGDDGELVLGAVEWVVPKAAWDAAGNSSPPVVFGHSLHILNPVLNWYVEHAWIWTENPSGMFMDWNPRVTCP